MMSERETATFFDCQICSVEFKTVGKFKRHLLRTFDHREQYKKVFPKEAYNRNWHSYTPWIFFKDIIYKPLSSQPVLGLSQMTLCFCSENRNGFYLCHVCEQIFHETSVVSHLSHVNHYSNYFAYTDPNALSFSLVNTGSNIHISLMKNIKVEQEKTGTGRLQVLHMPRRLFAECTSKNYCQVMFLLYQNKSLSDIFKGKYPERIRIQTFKDDSNRKHPLLGLQHIVECICTPHTHLRHYLCTLCRLHVSSSLIIRHLLSFEHVFNYLSTWHPSTLKPKACYMKDCSGAAGALAGFATQSEQLHGPKEIQQLTLNTSQMLTVLNVNFNEALSKIESIAKKGSLIPTVTPGIKLGATLSASDKIPTNVKQDSTKSEPVTSRNSSSIQNIKEEIKESTTEHRATPAAPSSYSFHCQNCSKNFETNALYCNHLLASEHQENLIKTFGPVMAKQTSECKPHFHSYKHFTDDNILCVGVSLVVSILSHQLTDEPIHLCFACETVFSACDLKLHMKSEKHIVQSLMYQNPWKLPFAWKTRLHYLYLKIQACKEEEERGPNKTIRILDVPPCLFPREAPVAYPNVMEKLDQHHPVLMNGIPQRETYSKLQNNDRFPFLGWDFLVKYGQTISGWKFLCLLCQRPLSSDDYTGHVFSWEHVVAFLEKFHPGSLDLNSTNDEVLLDLAKQAANIHCISSAQEIECDPFQHKTDVKDYSSKVRLLSDEKVRNGKGPLIPSITPKAKLFPRQQTPEENPNTQTNASNAVTETQSIPGKPVDEVTCFQAVNDLSAEKEAKEEKNPSNPSEPSQSEESKSAKSSSCESMMKTASKRQRSPFDMDISDSETENAGLKRKCQSNPEEKKEIPLLQNVDKTKPCRSSDAAVDDSVPCYGCELQSYIQKRSRDPVIGLSAIYECLCNDRAPIYLCNCCRLIFKEPHITKHVSETWHYHCYLHEAGEHPLPKGKYWKAGMAKLAKHWERTVGYGEAQVVKLMPEDYESLASTSEYNKGFNIVKKHLPRKLSKITWSPALHEDCARTVTLTGQKTSQQNMQVEIDPEPVETSLKTKLPSKNEISSESLIETNLTGTSDHKLSKVDATSCNKDSESSSPVVTVTSTAPTISASSLLNNCKSSSITKDGSESANIVEDTSNAIPTGASKSSQPVCKFITTRAVIPEVESKTVNTHENTDKIQYATPASFTSTDTPKPSTKLVVSTPSMSNLTATTVPASTCNSDFVTLNTQQMTSALLVHKVTDCAAISAVAVSNATRGTPNLQNILVQPDAVPKCKANSAIDSEPTSKVAMLGNDHLSAKKAATESSSSETKVPSATPDTSTPKTSNVLMKSKGIQLKLKAHAASHVNNDDLVRKIEPLTPTTPNSGPLMLTAETSQKAPSPHVGLDQLVKVKCIDKRLVFCFACLATLEGSNHLTSRIHQINCVQRKFPRLGTTPSDEELSKMVALLHDEEKTSNVEAKQIEVSYDVYKELKSLPNDKAIEKVKCLLKKKKVSKKLGQRRPSASTSEAPNSLCDISTSPNISVSPCDATSPHLGKENCQTNLQINVSAQPIIQLPVTARYAPSPSPLVQKPTSKVAPRIIKGSTTDDPSNLSRILAVKDTSVIGLCFVWECRVVPPKHPTFYLCESCSLTISVNDICDHMRSTKHHSKYLIRQYPQFMYWAEEELLSRMSDMLTDYIADLVKGREDSMDAQTVLLSEECFEWVRTAPFVEALNVVQRIKQEKKMTTLPLIVPPQVEVEPTLDTPRTFRDLPNQMEISLTEGAGGITDLTEHEACSGGIFAQVNAESCTSPTFTGTANSPQITEPHDSQSQSPPLTKSPKQPDEPADSASNKNFAVSPKGNQEHFDPEMKARFDITSPFSHDLAVLSPFVETLLDISIETTSSATHKDACLDIKPKSDVQLGSPSVQETSTVSPITKTVEEDLIETTSLATIKDACRDLKPESDIQLGSPSFQETSAVSSDLLEDNVSKAVDEDLMTEEGSPHDHSDTSREYSSLMVSSMVDHNANETPPLNPEDKAALDKHYCLLLINFLKNAKNSMKHLTPSSNQTSEPFTIKSPESNEQCEAPQHSSWYVGQPPKTDTDEAAKIDNIVTSPSVELQSENLTSGTCVSNMNTEKSTSVSVTSVLIDNLNEATTSELATQQSQGQHFQSKDDEPVEKSKVQMQLPKIQIEQKVNNIKQMKMTNNVSDSHILMQTSQLEIQMSHTEKQYHSALHSEIVQSQSQASQQQQEQQLKSATQEVTSKCPPHTSPILIKHVHSDSRAVQLQTQQTPVQVIQQTQNQELQLQSPTWVAQSQNATQQGQFQEERAPIQHVTNLTQGQTEQVPIISVITPRRQHNTIYFRRHAHNQQNTNFSVSQGPPPSSAATHPVTSGSMGVTGDYRQFVQTACPSDADYSNTCTLFGVPHGYAYPSPFYHQLQPQCYTSVQPHLQHPEASGWFNPNTQLQPVAHNHPAWSNGTVGRTSNVAYLNAVSFNTVTQSYTYTHNNMQEYNGVTMQDHFYSPSSAPTQTNSQFFPHRQ